jgi:hypothetical protein
VGVPRKFSGHYHCPSKSKNGKFLKTRAVLKPRNVFQSDSSVLISSLLEFTHKLIREIFRLFEKYLTLPMKFLIKLFGGFFVFDHSRTHEHKNDKSRYLDFQVEML